MGNPFGLSDRLLHTLAQVMVGYPPNGTRPEQIDPWLRALFGEVAALPRGERVDRFVAGLHALGFAEGEIDQLVAAISARDPGREKPPAPRPLLQFLRGPELRVLPPMEWLIPDLIPRSSTIAMYGPSGHGKSFLMLHLACHVALGWQWYGREARPPAPVIYFAAEGQMGFRDRYIAWCAHYNKGRDIPNFILSPQPMYPTAQEFVDALYTYVDSLADQKPALIVFDTLFRCFDGDENATADMARFVRATDAIRTRIDTVIGLVHHSGWNSDRLRGNSSLLGALEVAMQVEQDELGTVSLTCQKMKDAERFAPWYFDLARVPGTASAVARLARDNQPPAGSTFDLPEDALAVLRAVTAAGGAGIGFSDLKHAAGITRDPTMSEVLRKLENGGYVRAEGEAGTKGRRYRPTAKGAMAVTSGGFRSASEAMRSDPPGRPTGRPANGNGGNDGF